MYMQQPKEVLNIGFLSHYPFLKTLFPSFLHHHCLQFLYPTNFLVRECFSLLVSTGTICYVTNQSCNATYSPPLYITHTLFHRICYAPVKDFPRILTCPSCCSFKSCIAELNGDILCCGFNLISSYRVLSQLPAISDAHYVFLTRNCRRPLIFRARAR